MEEPRITPELRQEFEEAFKLFDDDGSGVITRDKLKRVMLKLKQSSTDQEIEDMINEVDADGNGKIDFSEFSLLMWRNVEKHDSEEEYLELFRIFDYENKNRISRENLKEIFEAIGIYMPDQEFQEIFEEADLEKTKYITYEEFVRMMSGQLHNQSGEV